MITFIKFFFTVFCSFYLFKRLLKADTCAAWDWFGYVASLVLATVMAFGGLYFQAGCFFAVVSLFCVVCGLRYKQPLKISFVAGTVAFGLSYIAMSVSSIVVFPVVFLTVLMRFPKNHVAANSYILAGLMQCFVVTIPFRLGRLKNGMPYLREGQPGRFGVVISLILLFASSLLFAHPGEDVRILLYFILAAESGFVLIVWWYNKILRRYLERIKNNKLEQLHTEVQQLENDKSAILNDNMELAKIIHSDSKVVPAMGNMLQEIIETAQFPDSEYKTKAFDFLEYMNNSIKERNSTFFNYHNRSKELPQTGVSGIDSMIRHMASRAYAQGINFEFVCVANTKHLTQAIISAGDLSKIIGDLLENSIIAEKDSEAKEILLSIWIRDSHYILDIADTGSAFAPAVIEKLGVEPVTTHAVTGGSGLGLVSVLEIAGKAGASFMLDEALKEQPFSKRLSICFDGLGQIRIKTERPEIVRLREIRQDIVWL